MRGCFIFLLFVASFLYCEEQTNLTPSKCQVLGSSIAHELADVLPELRNITCKDRVAKYAKKHGLGDECVQIATLACMVESDKVKWLH